MDHSLLCKAGSGFCRDDTKISVAFDTDIRRLWAKGTTVLYSAERTPGMIAYISTGNFSLGYGGCYIGPTLHTDTCLEPTHHRTITTLSCLPAWSSMPIAQENSNSASEECHAAKQPGSRLPW
ncbi:hypothetical protein H1C71_004246 [Ictidomys tridecemlineatus]|nr:hypothetical protein H1C71_004246 [Ictidomys tridecemlineatus]